MPICKRMCDRDCNNCNITENRQLSVLLNTLVEVFGENRVYPIVQDACPNMTVCADCRIDDFCHVEGCKIYKESRRLAKKWKAVNAKNKCTGDPLNLSLNSYCVWARFEDNTLGLAGQAYRSFDVARKAAEGMADGSAWVPFNRRKIKEFVVCMRDDTGLYVVTNNKRKA